MAQTFVSGEKRNEVTRVNAAEMKPDWRLTCRHEAEAAAREEARIAWHVPPEESIPFNYRWEHVQQVVRTACWLADAIGADREISEAAAWLHDVRKIEPEHAKAGARAARNILIHTDFPAEKIEAVCTAIAEHEGLTRDDPAPMASLEAALLWDADKLTKLGVQALAYNLGTPRMRGRTLAERLASMQTFTATVLRQTVASMNTEPARALAERRHAEMTAALEAWARDAHLR
jgi:HD superfamily phosphodiesterase